VLYLYSISVYQAPLFKSIPYASVTHEQQQTETYSLMTALYFKGVIREILSKIDKDEIVN